MRGAAFVGRSRELQSIDRTLDSVGAGQCGLLLISGAAGIGKSRLADELCARAQARGFATAWGGAWEAGGAPSFWPWPQVLRTLERKLGELADPALVARLALRPDSEASAALASSDRFALFDAVARCVAVGCERAPLALVLDDVHAADVASLGLLEFLARQLRDLPVLLVATYREAEARELEQVDAVLGRLRREATVLRLGALADAEIRALMSADGSEGATDDQLAERVCELTGGSPLFVLEVLHVLESDPGALSSDALASADGLRAAIREHLRLLKPDVRAALAAAALIGREFTSVALRALHDEALDDRLAQAIQRGVIVNAGHERFRFVHVLLRDTLHADIEAARRAQLHAQYADWLAAAPASSRAESLAEIAHHLLLAGPEHAQAATDSVLAAADHATRMFAFEHAVELCQRALEALDLARCADPERRFELQTRIGIARIAAGEVALGKAECMNAAGLARRELNALFLARATLAYGTAFSFGNVDPVLVRLCEESLATLPADALELRARVLARHAAALQPSEDVNIPVRIAREALALVDSLSDPHVKLSVAFNALSALMDIVDPRERRPWNDRILAWATELGEPGMALHTRRRTIVDQLELGDLDAAKREVEAYAHASQHLKHRQGRWQLPMFRGAIALAEGRFAEHARLFAEAKAIGEPLIGQGIPGIAFILHELATARAHTDPARASAAIAAVSSFLPPIMYYWDALRANEAAQRGAFEQARTILAQWDPSVIGKHRDGMLMGFEAETAVMLEDHTWARAVRAELESNAEAVCSWGLVAYVIDGPLQRPLFLVCALLGDWEAAEKNYKLARAFCERHGNRPMLSRVQLDWAELLARRNDARLVPEIEALARASERIAREFDMPGALERAARLLANATSSHSNVRLAREGDVWRLSGFGASCVVRESRGLAFLARLLEQPHRELHVLDLVDAPAEVRHEHGPELIDEPAQRAYRARAQELQSELAEAEEFQDLGRAERARDELEALRAELARGIGLGGRARRSATATERARVNVQRRIADAIERIRSIEPKLAEHLQQTIRTGTSCAYEPR